MKQVLLLVLFVAIVNCKSIEDKLSGKKKIFF